jgi:hypothetical protein
MFWREAVEESRARVLRQRFRHPWTYALLLFIATLLWFAIAGLATKSQQGPDYLLILDGSVGMTHTTRFEDATKLLLADAEGLPADRREVWWSGEQTQLLLAKGEHALLLHERLRNKQPQATASALERRVLNLAGLHSAPQALQVRIYGDAPFSHEALALLPQHIEVQRCTPLTPQRPANAGFLAGGMTEAISGKWDCVDIFAHVIGSKEAPSLSSEGKPLSLTGTATPTEDGMEWRFSDVPARGQILEFQLAQTDTYPADNQMVLALPQRQPLRVLLAPALQTIFEPLIAADSAFSLASREADLVIRRPGDTLGLGLPALLVANAPANGYAFEFTGLPNQDADQLLQRVHRTLGLAEIDALALAQQLQQPITLGVSLGPQRQVQIWRKLLDPDTGFLGSRSFPLFIGRSLRWLAHTQGFPAVARTHQPLAHTDGDWQTPSNGLAVTAGLPLRPGIAGFFRSKDNRTVAVNAFDSLASQTAAGTQDAPAGLPIHAPSLPLWSWLVLVALLFLAAEWFFFQTGRIP